MSCVWSDELHSRFGAIVGPNDEQALDLWPPALKRRQAGITASVPRLVATPRHTRELAALVAWASGRGVPIVPRGGGSSVTGSPVSSSDALVVSTAALVDIALDDVDGLVRAGAGVHGGELERTLATHRLTTWFSPQSLGRSTVGGWIATRASGQFSTRFGGIEDAVVQLTAVLPDGRTVTVGTPPRGAVGPDLRWLFLGSEGAFGIVTEAVLRVFPVTALSLATFELPAVSAALETLRDLMHAGVRPALLRLYDPDGAKYLHGTQATKGAVLIVGFTGPAAMAAAEEAVTRELLGGRGARDLGTTPAAAWFERRYDFSRIESVLAEPGGYAETIEVSFGWRRAFASYRALRSALEPCADQVVAHFSHAYGDGISCYLTIAGRAPGPLEAAEKLEEIWRVAMEAALECGAVISHHHGVGLARRPYLARQLGDGFSLLAALKQAVDPRGLAHPGSLLVAPVIGERD